MKSFDFPTHMSGEVCGGCEKIHLLLCGDGRRSREGQEKTTEKDTEATTDTSPTQDKMKKKVVFWVYVLCVRSRCCMFGLR